MYFLYLIQLYITIVNRIFFLLYSNHNLTSYSLRKCNMTSKTTTNGLEEKLQTAFSVQPIVAFLVLAVCGIGCWVIYLFKVVNPVIDRHHHLDYWTVYCTKSMGNWAKTHSVTSRKNLFIFWLRLSEGEANPIFFSFLFQHAFLVSQHTKVWIGVIGVIPNGFI